MHELSMLVIYAQWLSLSARPFMAVFSTNGDTYMTTVSGHDTGLSMLGGWAGIWTLPILLLARSRWNQWCLSSIQSRHRCNANNPKPRYVYELSRRCIRMLGLSLIVLLIVDMSPMVSTQVTLVKDFKVETNTWIQPSNCSHIQLLIWEAMGQSMNDRSWVRLLACV